jgi:hypoxanthine phosphoribosyltransferase
MDTIQIKDKRFTTFIPEERILREVERVASEINRDLEGTNPLFLSVLNGSFMFAADLMRNLTIPSEISFVKLASYAGTSSTGKVKELVGLNDDIEGDCGRYRGYGSHNETFIGDTSSKEPEGNSYCHIAVEA